MAGNTDIAEALFDRLKTFSHSPTFAIAWPDKPFTPTAGTGYLKASFLPAQPYQAAAGDAGENRFMGFLQIDVVWPDGKGLKDPLTVADLVAAHFKRGTTLTASGFYVSVNRPPYVMQAGPFDAGWVSVPVRVYYLADIANPA